MLRIAATAKGKNLPVLSSTLPSSLPSPLLQGLHPSHPVSIASSRSRGICRQLVEASILSYFQDAEAAIKGCHPYSSMRSMPPDTTFCSEETNSLKNSWQLHFVSKPCASLTGKVPSCRCSCLYLTSFKELKPK